MSPVRSARLAQAVACLPPHPHRDAVLAHQHQDAHRDHEDGRAARDDQGQSGRGGAGEAVDDHDERGDDHGDGRDDGGRAGVGDRRPADAEQARQAARRRTVPAAGVAAPRQQAEARPRARLHPGRQAEQARRHRSRPAARGCPGGRRRAGRSLRASRRRSAPSGRCRGPATRRQAMVSTGSSAPSTARSASGCSRSSRKVCGPFARVVELAAERDHPVDDEQGDRHDVAVGQPRQHRAGVAAFLVLGQHHHPGRRGRQREQRRHVGQRELPAG